MSTLTPLPSPTTSDLKRLALYDSGCRVRGMIEMALVRRLATHLVETGHSITVNDGEGYPVKKGTDVESILDACFAVEECWLDVFRGRNHVGTIFLVFGNDGWDAISDYHTSLTDLLEPVCDYADHLSDWC